MTLTERIKIVASQRGETFASLERQLGFGQGTIRKWDKNSPSVDKVRDVAECLNTPLAWLINNEHDEVLPVGYNNLNDIEKALVLERIQSFIAVRKATEAAAAPPLAVVPPTAQPAPAVAPAAPDDDEDADEEDDTIDMLIYDEPAAAGYGFDRDEWAGAETLPFPASEVARGANFGIRISGDSMEPDIEDGSIVWVRDGVWVDSGQIGVFVYNNRVFCKKLRQDPETRRISLVSFNKRYKPIPVTAPEEFHLVGKVLGVYSNTI